MPIPTEIPGQLDIFLETGTEGAIWILDPDEKGPNDPHSDYGHRLEKGDRRKVFNEDGTVAFEGVIDPNRRIGWTEYPRNPGHGQPSALGLWIHWTQSGWKPDAWARLFLPLDGHPRLKAILTKANPAS